MARFSRVVMPGIPHHVSQRGNRQCDVFLDVEDREVYLRLLRHYFAERGIGTVSYCLMTNHTHLIALPESEAALATGLRDTQGVYALYFNHKYGLRGHLWQGRFFSCPLDRMYFWNAVRYVERNPVRAGIIDRAEAYPWSSAQAHCQDLTPSWLAPLPRPVIVQDWAAWLAVEEPDSDLRQIRSNTRTGRPCGSNDFVEWLEGKLGRTLRPGKPGPQQFRGQTSLSPGTETSVPGSR